MVHWAEDPDILARSIWDQNKQTFESTIFPEAQPFNTGHLLVDPDTGQSLYFEEFGRSDWKAAGIRTVVYLHGGPGAGQSPYFHRFFDPAEFHIVVYDQRGAPKSARPALTQNNTPDLLVEDNEQLRRHLAIDQWHVFGGSWGSTLALLYAEKCPDAVASLTLRGIFLMRPREIDWFLTGMGGFFPEARRDFEAYLPEADRTTLLKSYWERLTDPDHGVHIPAAQAWAAYENSCCFRHIPPVAERNDTPGEDLCTARLEAEFLLKYPLGDRILEDVARIRRIPTLIVQGRHDVVCPPATAYELAEAMGDSSRLLLVDAGHSAKEPDIAKALVEAANRIRDTGTPLP